MPYWKNEIPRRLKSFRGLIVFLFPSLSCPGAQHVRDQHLEADQDEAGRQGSRAQQEVHHSGAGESKHTMRAPIGSLHEFRSFMLSQRKNYVK